MFPLRRRGSTPLPGTERDLTLARVDTGRLSPLDALRHGVRRHHRAMHQVVGYLERLLILVILLFLGMALTRTLLAGVDWRAAVVAVALVFVIRPLAAWLALSVAARDSSVPGGLTRSERVVTAFFGVRGVGSLYYLAYAGGLATIAEESWLWSTVAFTILLSVVVHGVASTPVLRRLGAHRAKPTAPAETVKPPDAQ